MINLTLYKYDPYIGVHKTSDVFASLFSRKSLLDKSYGNSKISPYRQMRITGVPVPLTSPKKPVPSIT